METVRVVIGKKLLLAVDRAARRAGCSRSALVREALREHLRRLDLREKDRREREGYLRHPQSIEEIKLWEGEAVWHKNRAR
jgi:metal-responsive CopG/Arc/MetJ family transcriptional regulator